MHVQNTPTKAPNTRPINARTLFSFSLPLIPSPPLVPLSAAPEGRDVSQHLPLGGRRPELHLVHVLPRSSCHSRPAVLADPRGLLSRGGLTNLIERERSRERGRERQTDRWSDGQPVRHEARRRRRGLAHRLVQLLVDGVLEILQHGSTAVHCSRKNTYIHTTHIKPINISGRRTTGHAIHKDIIINT
jgi:hypothetical protein